MSPVLVFTTMVLPNGWTVNSSPYVTLPSPSPAGEPANVRSARMPPGFMNATTAPPKSVGAVAASCASAITSPSAVSPDSPGATSRVISDVIEPTTRLAIGAAIALYLSTIAASAGSLATSRVTSRFTALAASTSLELLSITRSMSVISRPKDEALVVRMPFRPRLQTYGWCVWADTTTSTSALRPSTIGAIAPVKLSQRLTFMNPPANGAFCWPPSWISTTNDRTPSSRRSFATRSLIVSISSRNSSPATPDGVTISGVPSSVRPRNATLMLALPTRRISYGGNSVSSVPSRNTFADRYWKNAPLNGSPSWQPSIGWQPPFCIRSSSFDPSSNSWLPTPVTSSPSSFMASIVGSSWSNAEMSGLAPIRSPAPTVIVFGFRSRRRSIQVARYSTPPASTVVVGPVAIRSDDPA